MLLKSRSATSTDSMKLNQTIITELTRPYTPDSLIRISPLKHKSTPLGMGWSNTKFSSPLRSFQLLYIAKDLKTALAETIIRDRFEGSTARDMMFGEVLGWGVVLVSASSPLLLLDLRTTGCLKLGVSTDIKGAKLQAESRAFSQSLYDQTSLDGILFKSRLTGVDCAAIYDRAVGLKLTAGKMMDVVGTSEFVPALRALRINLIR